jgi:hypothetical protein
MKNKKNKTEIEVRYKRFDRWSKLLMYSLLLITLICAVFFLFVNSDSMKLLFGCILFAMGGDNIFRHYGNNLRLCDNDAFGRNAWLNAKKGLP